MAIDIRTLEVLEGEIPPCALRVVEEWASQHQQEFMRGWKLAQSLAQSNEPPEKISSLIKREGKLMSYDVVSAIYAR